MKRSIIFGLFLICFTFVGCQQKQSQACFDSKCVSIELAQTSEELSQGLQYRKSLDKDVGMLFIFDQPAEAKFWMKNTLIPLDIIWLNNAGEVIYIEKSAPPCLSESCPTYGSSQPARYVLEVNAGFADVYDINVGDGAQILIQPK